MVRRRSLLAALGTGGSLGLAGCADAGGPTTPDLLEFSLPTAAETVPTRYTCEADDGVGVSPPIEITSVPPPTEALALVFEYPNSVGGTFTHWVAWNLPADTDRVPEAVPTDSSPPELDGGVQGQNGTGRVGYVGPCPPPSEEPQRYWLTLYALRRELDVPAGSERDPVDDALETATLASKRLTTYFRRPLGSDDAGGTATRTPLE
ncbi:YbhB/YbcL family Raf kinase inhibitor-like protein [Salinirubellus salinus]|uniref:YbhB/YbcL family Raf kinase inhibitor-like protein n=1 Tax=Salinirubellus salinus TaxID=1364945 RepID=A0A9E7R675_9EURY|nr:YbhB/YbcL family Raf kinase inhibitor-like protein [Salinirubellus salinus]UWM56352.1 YbhB/YbcL family Raf kinase inhibitor-like protein [Salinirubellus salinus]